jgi:MarR family transcriptional regulator, 2-MHQ and catechol-resistance regulon repressor
MINKNMAKTDKPFSSSNTPKLEPGIQSLEEQLYRNITRLELKQISDVTQLIKQYGLTNSEHSIIHHIYCSTKNSMTMSELGNYLFTYKPNITRTVLSLESKKLIIKKTDSKDKRITWISLTQKAINLLAEMSESMTRLHSSHFSNLNKTEKKHLAELLEKALSDNNFMPNSKYSGSIKSIVNFSSK